MSTETTNLQITVSLKTLTSLLTKVFPNPDDPDWDWGPLGPVIRALNQSALNPQPLPPRWAGKPVPEPWRAARLGRALVDRLVGNAQAAEFAGGEQARQRFSEQLKQLADDHCGTPPRIRFPLPGPWPWPLPDDFTFQPVELVVLGVQFYQASEAISDATLKAAFAEAASQFTTTGLQRLA